MFASKRTHVFKKTTYAISLQLHSEEYTVPPVPRQCTLYQYLKYRASLGQLHSNRKTSEVHKSQNSCSTEQKVHEDNNVHCTCILSDKSCYFLVANLKFILASDGTIYRIVSNIAILRSYRGISLLR